MVNLLQSSAGFSQGASSPLITSQPASTGLAANRVPALTATPALPVVPLDRLNLMGSSLSFQTLLDLKLWQHNLVSNSEDSEVTSLHFYPQIKHDLT